MINLSTDTVLSEDLPSSSKWVKDNFVVGEVLGSGSFGKVYTVECRKRPHTLYAMKEITRGSQPRFIATEIKTMKQLGGSHNVMKLHAAHREKDRIFIVMDHFPHDSLKTLLGTMTNLEKINYMKNLFVSLDYLHRNNIIHRDIKPANFLYCRRTKKYALIDFGLAQSYIPVKTSAISPGSKENCSTSISPRKRTSKCLSLSSNGSLCETTDKRRKTGCNCSGQPAACRQCINRPPKSVNKAGTPGFRAPEILLKFDEIHQTPALDIWSAGILLMGLLFGRHPVFRPADDFEALAQMCQLFGSASIIEVARLRGVSLIVKPVYRGVDLVKLMRCVRPGMDFLDGQPRDRCEHCCKLFFKNVKGKCLCKSEESSSLEGLSLEERLLVAMMQKCLQPDPAYRFTASMLLDLIENQGF